MLWLLVLGAVALGGLAVAATDPVLAVSYAAGAVVDVGLLVGVLLRRLQVQSAITALLVLGLALGIGVLIDVATYPDLPVVDAGFLLFRASVLISGVAFLAAGPRIGAVVALSYVLAVVIVMQQVGAPVIGTDREPGTFAVACLLIGVVAIFRAMGVRVRSLEHTARRATAEAALAYRDELTGLPNRRAMSRLLAEVTEDEGRGGHAVVMLFDLDHFKVINDTMGHNVGDDVLQRTAALASAAVRDSDQVARWGGEEFLAVLQGLELAAAVQVAERTRRMMADVGGATGVTASFGVTPIGPGDRVDDVVARADRALYAAKRAGRDQVWVCGGDGHLRAAAPGTPPSTAGSGVQPVAATGPAADAAQPHGPPPDPDPDPDPGADPEAGDVWQPR